MRIFSTSLIVVACFAACAAHATDATILALPELYSGCTVNGVEGRWMRFNADSPEQLQWYNMHGRLDTGCQLEGELFSPCYCNFGASSHSVSDDWTDGNWNTWGSEYMVPEPTPPIAGATWVRVFDTYGAPQGIPCNDPDVHCYYVALVCENDVGPIDGKCPTSTTEQGPTTEQEPTTEQGPTTEPLNGATTAEQEHEGSPGCPKYTYRVENNECLPIGGYMDAHIPGNIRYAGRKCTGDTLRNYDPNATAGYWTRSIYGRHACPLGEEFVRCACGSTLCKNGYTAQNGYCRLNASEGVTSDAADSAGGAGDVEQRSDAAATQSTCPDGYIIDEGGTEPEWCYKRISINTNGAQFNSWNQGYASYADMRQRDDAVSTSIWVDSFEGNTVTIRLYNNDLPPVLKMSDNYEMDGGFILTGGVGTEAACSDKSSNGFDMSTITDWPNTDVLYFCRESVLSGTVGAGSGPASNDTISELAKTLDAIENAYGLSKWRTEDGKFNYARLASDATAAVVLGTTGALVTSSVVKKKQVEAGFESLECTVGGQHVGDWGDVFRIDGK